MDAEKGKSGEEQRRRYARLDHIFPVELRFRDAALQPASAWLQGFSQDIGVGGLCVTVNHLDESCLRQLQDPQAIFDLAIHLPVGGPGIEAVGRAAWFKKMRDEPLNQYVVGVAYARIEARDNRRLLGYVTARRWARRFALFFLCALSLGFIGSGALNARMRWEQESLSRELSRTVRQQESLKRHRDDLAARAQEMGFLLSQTDKRVAFLEDRLGRVQETDLRAIKGLGRALRSLRGQREKLAQEMCMLSRRKKKVDADVQATGRQLALAEEGMLGKMIGWLETHQNNATGLVVSYEGDREALDYAFTYDQALAAMVFVMSGHDEQARRILDFFLRAPRVEGGAWANAYYATSGDVAESIGHAGPNIWIGLAALQYADATQDDRYLGLALQISQWLGTVTDDEGGVRGGARLTWYSTEHNLDAYAFYRMLAQWTKEEAFARRADRTLSWLRKNAFSNLGVPPVKRGKGDSTIATDTFAWSVTAIGPQTLKESGMDPDEIMDFAIENCRVTVPYEKPSGEKVTVSGFDFALSRNLARGGVVSCEWTAQMILALRIMAEHHAAAGDEERSRGYSQLASESVSELSKMVIASLSPVGQGAFCLPYASHAFADTGHGWRTPKGDRTGSVAATAYAILALRDINPLRFNLPSGSSEFDPGDECDHCWTEPPEQ